MDDRTFATVHADGSKTLPCKYCGQAAPRHADEDCPLRAVAEDFDPRLVADVVNQDQDAELRRLRGEEAKAEQLARAVETFIQSQRPFHTTAGCVDIYGGAGHVIVLASEDWSAAGCEQLCRTCLLNRALAIVRGRA